MERFAGHAWFGGALAVAAPAVLVAVCMLAGCSCAPQPKQAVTQPTASETATPAVETTPLPTETTPSTMLPTASGPVFSVTSSSHPAERKAILAAAHAYLDDPRSFVVNQIAVQDPFALASLTTQGGTTWVVALRKTASSWQGVWKGKRSSGSKAALADAARIDAPDLVAYFKWSTPETPVTESSAAAYIKKTLSAGTSNADAKVKSVDIKVFEKDSSGTVWVGALVENNLDGGIVFAKKPAGKSWVIVDFGTGIDGSEMEGRAPSAIAAKFKAAFPQ